MPDTLREITIYVALAIVVVALWRTALEIRATIGGTDGQEEPPD